MDRRGKSWLCAFCSWIEFSFSTFPESEFCVCFTSFQELLWKVPDLNNKWKLPWFRLGQEAQSQLFGPTPNLADPKMHSEFGRAGNYNEILKWIQRAEKCGNVRSIFVGSAEESSQTLPGHTRNWRQVSLSAACLLHTFNTVTTVCPLPCYHTHSLVRVSNGCIYRKLGKGLVLHPPWGFQRKLQWCAVLEESKWSKILPGIWL